jgi:hypothetical protein
MDVSTSNMNPIIHLAWILDLDIFVVVTFSSKGVLHFTMLIFKSLVYNHYLLALFLGFVKEFQEIIAYILLNVQLITIILYLILLLMVSFPLTKS